MPGSPLPGVTYLLGDVEELGQMIGALAGADAVIHLAAIRRWGLTTNEVTFRTNVMGTFNVHEAAWRLGIRRVVSTSSLAVMGWEYREREFLPEYLPIDERHPVHPQDSYGLSKEVGEAIARSYTAKCGLETVVLRPPWVASPEELEQVAAQDGHTPTRFGTFTYVDVRDLAVAFRLAVERAVEGHLVLFVAADDSTVAGPLSKVLVNLAPAIGQFASALGDESALVSSARAKAILDWKPVHSWRRLKS